MVINCIPEWVAVRQGSVSARYDLVIAETKAGAGKAHEADRSLVQYEIEVALADRDQKVTGGPDGKVSGD